MVRAVAASDSNCAPGACDDVGDLELITRSISCRTVRSPTISFTLPSRKMGVGDSGVLMVTRTEQSPCDDRPMRPGSDSFVMAMV